MRPLVVLFIDEAYQFSRQKGKHINDEALAVLILEAAHEKRTKTAVPSCHGRRS